MKDQEIFFKIVSILRVRRLEMNLSQKDLAIKSGIHPNFIGGIERGKRNPSLKVLLKITKALGLKINLAPPTM